MTSAMTPERDVKFGRLYPYLNENATLSAMQISAFDQ